jgi:hypothetical protein
MGVDIASPYPDLPPRHLLMVVVNIVFFLGIYEMFENHTTVGSTFAKRRALPDLRIASMTYKAAPVGLHNG